MSKQIESVFTLERIDEVNTYLNQGKYVTTDLKTAFEAIKTILTEEQLNEFIINALNGLNASTFIPLNFKQIRNYINHEFEMIERRGVQNFDIDKMRHLVDYCEIYAQQYDIKIKNPKSNIFIWRIPSQEYFDIAKNTIMAILNELNKGQDIQEIEGVTITIRGKEKFLDINIEGINDEAWVGFDFR